MSQSRNPSTPKKLHFSTAWSCGPRTLQWERLWRRILRNISIESQLKEEKPSTDEAIDGV